MKVVFDTNVYVAEALGGETASRIVESTTRASWVVYISRHIVDELTKVLVEDLEMPPRSATLAAIRAVRNGRLATPTPSRHTVAGDAADSDVLRTALAAGANYLVTNDRHLLELHPYESVQIVTMAEYRRMLEHAGLLV